MSGLTLKSNPGESLVVKLLGTNAGFTADGVLLDIDDRIGGSVYVVGRPNFPVVLTSLRDDAVGASPGLDGFPLTDTNNDGIDLYDNADPSVFTPDGKDDLTGAPFTGAVPDPGNWRSLKFTQDSNDRNVKFLFEAESANNGGLDINGNPGQAEFLGVLAPDYKSGDDNRSLGIELHGNISADSSADVRGTKRPGPRFATRTCGMRRTVSKLSGFRLIRRCWVNPVNSSTRAGMK